MPSVFYRLSFADFDVGSNEMLFGPSTLAAVAAELAAAALSLKGQSHR